MPKLRVPGYCIHRAKKQAYVRLGGRMIYLGVPDSAESKSRYDRVIADYIAAGRVYVRPEERQGLSINEILLAYGRFAETDYVDADGVTTQEVVKINCSLRPVVDLFGESPAKDFGPKALIRVRERMVADGLCRQTVNQRIGCVKRAFVGPSKKNSLILRSTMALLRSAD